mmetsp:Transcript_25391/g.56229  ORF Transcript_25391/g.56229 Transcript_25391/m.56229 type:complete len:389 (-) Transcript_25391:2648-3814(-)
MRLDSRLSAPLEEPALLEYLEEEKKEELLLALEDIRELLALLDIGDTPFFPEIALANASSSSMSSMDDIFDLIFFVRRMLSGLMNMSYVNVDKDLPVVASRSGMPSFRGTVAWSSKLLPRRLVMDIARQLRPEGRFELSPLPLPDVPNPSRLDTLLRRVPLLLILLVWAAGVESSKPCVSATICRNSSVPWSLRKVRISLTQNRAPPDRSCTSEATFEETEGRFIAAQNMLSTSCSDSRSKVMTLAWVLDSIMSRYRSFHGLEVLAEDLALDLNEASLRDPLSCVALCAERFCVVSTTAERVCSLCRCSSTERLRVSAKCMFSTTTSTTLYRSRWENMCSSISSITEGRRDLRLAKSLPESAGRRETAERGETTRGEATSRGEAMLDV